MEDGCKCTKLSTARWGNDAIAYADWARSCMREQEERTQTLCQRTCGTKCTLCVRMHGDHTEDSEGDVNAHTCPALVLQRGLFEHRR